MNFNAVESVKQFRRFVTDLHPTQCKCRPDNANCQPEGKTRM